MTESELMKRIQILASQSDCRLFRNNTGQGWQGRTYRPTKEQAVAVSPRDLIIYNARPVNFGLVTGSADLIGWHQRTITEDDLGKQIAIFLSVETKTLKGRITNAQEAWAKAVNLSGGIGLISKTTLEFVEQLKQHTSQRG